MHTLGDHLRKRRLDLGLEQKQLAAQLGVTESSVWNWENNESRPTLRCLPPILRFLGYNPLPKSESFAGRLVTWRTERGIRRRAAAALIGVDEGTLAGWERGEREPKGDLLGRVLRFFESVPDK